MSAVRSSRSAEPPVRVPRATLPDLRQEQFFLTTVRKHVRVAEPDGTGVVPVEEPRTPWQDTTRVAW